MHLLILGGGWFLVARRDSMTLFDPIKEPLDPVAGGSGLLPLNPSKMNPKRMCLTMPKLPIPGELAYALCVGS